MSTGSFGFVRLIWVRLGVIGFIRARLLGSFTRVLAVVISVRRVRSGAPRVSLGPFGFIGSILMRPGRGRGNSGSFGDSVASWESSGSFVFAWFIGVRRVCGRDSLGSFVFALGIVVFIRVHWAILAQSGHGRFHSGSFGSFFRSLSVVGIIWDHLGSLG